jgi:cyclophilin family peptidyl-prolyl cis-trans isomerase/HEAT repeat protein
MRDQLKKLCLMGLCLALLHCGNTADSIPVLEDQRTAHSQELVDLLQGADAARRLRSAQAMGRIQSPFYAESLAVAVSTDDEATRKAALFALGQLGLAEGAEPDAQAIEACITALDDADQTIVVLALEALGKLAAGSAEKTIAAFLTHASPDVRATAVDALMRRQYVPVWRGETDDAPELSQATRTALIGRLGDASPDVRWRVAHLFSRNPHPEAVAGLVSLIDDPAELARLFAIRAIGGTGDATVVDALLPALDDASAAVRVEAVRALGTLDQAGRLDGRLPDEPSFHVRAALARALSGLNGATTPETLTRLRELETDPSPAVRMAAMDALAQRSGAAYGAALRQYLADESWLIRAAAAQAAGHLEEAGVPLIETALGDADHRVAAAALEALRDIEGHEALIEASLSSPDLAVRGTAVSLIAERDHEMRSAWLKQAYDRSTGVDWIEIREAIVDALADLADAEPVLREIMSTDTAASVQSKAALALKQRGVAVPDLVPAPIEPSPFLSIHFDRDPMVVLETTRGDIVIRALASEAPQHVANLVQLVEQGFYDGLSWHRVVPNFVIQGGDPRGDGWGGPGYTLRDEINQVRFERGAVGMPKAGKDTGGSQIFITHLPTPHLDGNYTLFGLVVEGLDVIDRIEVGDQIVRAYLDPRRPE